MVEAMPNGGEPKSGQGPEGTRVGEARAGEGVPGVGLPDTQLQEALNTPGFRRTAEQRVRIAAHEKALTTPPVEPAEPSLGDLARQAQAEVGGEEPPPTVPAETPLGQPPITAEPTAGIGEEVGGEAVGREEKETAEGEKGITAEDWTAAERETGGSKEEPVGGQEGAVAPEEAAGEVADEREVLQQDLMSQMREALGPTGNFDQIRETVRQLAQQSVEGAGDADEALSRILQKLEEENAPPEQRQQLENEVGSAIDEGVGARRDAQREAEKLVVAAPPPPTAKEEAARVSAEEAYDYTQFVATGRSFLENSLQELEDFAKEKGLEKMSLYDWAREKYNIQIQSRVDMENALSEADKMRQIISKGLLDARVSPDDELLHKVGEILAPGDDSEIQKNLRSSLKLYISAGVPQVYLEEQARLVTFPEDKAWVGSWKAFLDEEERLREKGVGIPTERVPPLVPEVPPIVKEGEAPPPSGSEVVEPKAGVVPAETLVAPERRLFAKKLVNALKTGVTNWVKNIDFRGKDKVWWAGVAVGTVESAAVIVVAPIPGMSGWVKSGLNLAAAQGVFGVARWGKMREGFGIRQQYSGEELASKLAEHEEKYAKATGRMRNFFLGVSAGATYVSATGLVGNVAAETLKDVAQGVRFGLPEIKPPDVAGGIKGFFDRFRGGAPAGAETPTPTPEAPVAPAGLSTEAKTAFDTIANNPEYLTQKAAWVGKELPISDEIIKNALGKTGRSLSELDPVTLEKTRLAIQNALENQANTIFDDNLENLTNQDSTVDLSKVVEASQKAAADWLATETAQTQLSEAAQKAIAKQLAAVEALANKVSEGLEVDPTMFTDRLIERGTTVGQMLSEAGYEVTWSGQDAQVFAAHIAANYDMLADMWDRMADARLIPDSVFPVSLPELNDLVTKAQAGDKEALQKLIEALHWIPAGSRLRILTRAGVGQALALLR